ncbi:MAG: DUF5104 domain-containing protein [Lachnospiraceae bacterium]|nr:DUF5104 domain-containing protein [Lachnospiraceae bacterium]
MKRNLIISKRRMSLFLVLIMDLVFILGLSGCSFPLEKKPDSLLQSDYLNHDIEYKDPDDKECLRVLVRLLQAVEQKDRETIKGMFSKEALDNIDDIDEKIDLFIETFPTWECKYDPSFGGMGKHANRGTITKWIKPTFNFESEGRQYVLKFIYFTEADENPDQLGLSMIQIYERYITGYSEDFKAQGEDSPHDIYLWDYTMDLQDRKPLLQTTPFGVHEKTDEEKYAYLDTMTSEEVSMIVPSDNVEMYYNKKLYSHQINHYYVALKELRFAYDYIEKNNAKDLVVFEGVQVNYFDQSLLSEKGPDCVIFHLADDERKTQIYINLEVNGDEVTVLNEDMVLKYIHD